MASAQGPVGATRITLGAVIAAAALGSFLSSELECLFPNGQGAHSCPCRPHERSDVLDERRENHRLMRDELHTA